MIGAVQEVLKVKGTDVVSILPDASLAAAVAMMEEYGVGSLVVQQADELCGVISERDILFRVTRDGADPAGVPVSQVMRGNPPTVNSSTSVADAIELITDHRCRHLPVLSGRNVVGVVSVGDLLKWTLLDMEARIGDVMAHICSLENQQKTSP